MDDVERVAARRARLALIFGLAVVAALGAALAFRAKRSRARRAAPSRSQGDQGARGTGREPDDSARRERARVARCGARRGREARKLAELRGRLAAEQSERRALAERTTRATRRLAAERADAREPSAHELHERPSRAVQAGVVAAESGDPWANARLLRLFQSCAQRADRRGERRGRGAGGPTAIRANARRPSSRRSRRPSRRRSPRSSTRATSAARWSRSSTPASRTRTQKIDKARADEKRLSDLVAAAHAADGGLSGRRCQPFAPLEGQARMAGRGSPRRRLRPAARGRNRSNGTAC